MRTANNPDMQKVSPFEFTTRLLAVQVQILNIVGHIAKYDPSHNMRHPAVLSLGPPKALS